MSNCGYCRLEAQRTCHCAVQAALRSETWLEQTAETAARQSLAESASLHRIIEHTEGN
jgi:hypothetical protein